MASGFGNKVISTRDHAVGLGGQPRDSTWEMILLTTLTLKGREKWGVPGGECGIKGRLCPPTWIWRADEKKR